MFALTNTLTYYLYGAPCDMRKSFDGLCGLIRAELGRQPLSGEVFIFTNRRRTHLKLLQWQPGGFVLYYKRLETGTFQPVDRQAGHRSIGWTELVMMIEGVQAKEIKQRRRYVKKTL